MKRTTRVVKIGTVRIGNGFPVLIQSMAKSKTSDVTATVSQIRELKRCGCEIVRVAVKDLEDAAAIKKIKAAVDMPLVADIHFDRRLALAAIESGVDKIRLNPGNIFKDAHLREVAACCRAHRIPIRVGINSGSLSPTGSAKGLPERMCAAALFYARRLERYGCKDIVISLKASTVVDTVRAYRRISGACDYPLHLGLTATGALLQGSIKSAIAIGALLVDGIGDTIRVSLTDTPAQEVRVARRILEAVGVRRFAPEIISCPTCGRCEVDLRKIVRDLERKLICADSGQWATHPKIAVMGCVVNGPGEAREADIGVAFGKGGGILFKKGRPQQKVKTSECVKVLLKEMKSLT